MGKYYYVALQWSFPNDEHTLCPPSMIKTDKALTSGKMYHRHMAIAQSAPSEARHNLGAWIAPDENNAADLEILCKKGHSMSNNIAASHLKRHEVMLAYKMMLHQAMKYNFSSTTLLIQQLDDTLQ